MHTLRHLFAQYREQELKGDKIGVQLQLGHSSLTTTEIYLRSGRTSDKLLEKMTA